eukprot:COSAG02_NODE_6528_length_3518_cov_5.108219_4_plen_138_part_00
MAFEHSKSENNIFIFTVAPQFPRTTECLHESHRQHRKRRFWPLGRARIRIFCGRLARGVFIEWGRPREGIGVLCSDRLAFGVPREDVRRSHLHYCPSAVSVCSSSRETSSTFAPGIFTVSVLRIRCTPNVEWTAPES